MTATIDYDNWCIAKDEDAFENYPSTKTNTNDEYNLKRIKGENKLYNKYLGCINKANQYLIEAEKRSEQISLAIRMRERDGCVLLINKFEAISNLVNQAHHQKWAVYRRAVQEK